MIPKNLHCQLLMLHCMVSGLFYHTECLMAVRNPSLFLLGHFQKQNTITHKQRRKLSLQFILLRSFTQICSGNIFYHILTISHFWDCYQNKKGLSMAAAHIQCWAILLFAYNYSLKYCSGSENLIAKFFGHFPSNEKYSFSSVKNKVFRQNSSMPQLHLKKLGKFQKETLSFQMLLILFYVGGLLK